MKNVLYYCTITHGTCEILDDYIRFEVIHTADHILPVLSIKYLINEDSNQTTPFKLATVTKPLLFYLCILFCPCVVQKATAYVGTKALNMSHQAKKGFWGILVETPQHQKGYILH